MEDYCPDFIAITETWFESKDMPNSMFVDPNRYWCYRKDRPTRGGGVCLFVKCSLNLVITEITLPDKFTDLELLAVDIANAAVQPFRIIVAYRPPDSTSDTNQLLISALDWLANDSVRVCIVGDLNLPAFNWEQFLYPSSKLYDLFADFISSHGLSQIADQPARGNSILDIVLCSDVLVS